MVVNIADTLDEIALQKGDKIGLIEANNGRSMTFSELNESANRFASYFISQGIAEGERVMLMVKPSAEFICLTFALFRIGAPVILIDPGMGYKNLLKCIEGVKPDYLVGIPKAIIFKTIFRKTFKSIKKSFSCGSLFGITGKDILKENKKEFGRVPVFKPDDNTLAAIIFTTGSTGPPKGVRFEHLIFAAQLQYIKDYYGIGADDVDQPGFPLFGLFSIAIGACAVIPDMDPTKPAEVDPVKFTSSIDRYGVTYSFGSPAIWNVVSKYCIEHKKVCSSLNKVLMAGAPVPGKLIKSVYKIMSSDGVIYTPYGATESLPIVSIEGKEIIEDTWQQTIEGKGTCVGRPLPGIDVKIIKPGDNAFKSITDCDLLPKGHIGEIIVKGKVVTRGYENNESENKFSKITDEKGFWHRIGDVGYFDEKDRLWFCGRKAHCVNSEKGIMYTIPCESIFNQHPDIFRSALVGINTEEPLEIPALIVEMKKNVYRKEADLIREVKDIALKNELTKSIKYFFVHPSFPVDIRHNAKIFREKLQVWAQEKIVSK